LLFLPRPKSKFQYYIYSAIELALLMVISYAILLAGLYLIDFRLLDYQLIVSLVVAEVPIGVFLSYILGERRHSDRAKMQEAVSMAHALMEFGHLKVYRVLIIGSWENYDYPALKYYVINALTNNAFRAPDFVHELAETKVIRETTFKTTEDLDKKMSEESITLHDHEPDLQELGLDRKF